MCVIYKRDQENVAINVARRGRQCDVERKRVLWMMSLEKKIGPCLNHVVYAEGLSDATCHTSYLFLEDGSKGDMRNGE